MRACAVMDEARAMKNNWSWTGRRVHSGERGYVMPLVAGGMVAFLGLAGLTIDVGHAYVFYNRLQAGTNAAALAAAQATSTSVDLVTSEANLYGSIPGSHNEIPGLQNVVTKSTQECLQILMPNGSSCATSKIINAVKVVQTASLPTYFLRLFGMNSISMKTTAQAAMQGLAQPWNVAIILDATGSMGSTDSDCGNLTEFQCATNGIKSLLSVVNPCAQGYTSCANGNANLRVALFSFPGVSADTVADYVNCGGTPNYMQYTLPRENATSYTPLTYTKTTSDGWHTTTTSWTATYQVTDFLSDYWANGRLNVNSALVQAVTKCMSPVKNLSTGTGYLNGGNSWNGSGITYYAGVIYAAQAALLHQQALHPGTKNAIIFLSDGQANVYAASNDFPSENGYSLAAGMSGYAGPAPNGAGHYPDVLDECQQAIAASQAATAAGTTVYSVAYGSEQSGCASGPGYTDKTQWATGQNAPFTLASLTPCVTMENIASTLGTFYSDFTQSGSGSTCQDNSHPVTSLQDIFLSIASTLTNPQLLPRDAQ